MKCSNILSSQKIPTFRNVRFWKNIVKKSRDNDDTVQIKLLNYIKEFYIKVNNKYYYFLYKYNNYI